MTDLVGSVMMLTQRDSSLSAIAHRFGTLLEDLDHGKPTDARRDIQWTALLDAAADVFVAAAREPELRLKQLKPATQTHLTQADLVDRDAKYGAALDTLIVLALDGAPAREHRYVWKCDQPKAVTTRTSKLREGVR